MNKSELLNKIDQLRDAAENFEGYEKFAAKDDISNLKIKVNSMIISDIANKMSSISLPEIEDMDDQIKLANDAIKSNESRVSAFNSAYGFLKNALGIVL